MIEREKVIYALEACVLKDPDDSRDCRHCPRCNYGAFITTSCINGVMADALALLKAQEPRVMSVDEVRKWVGKQRVDREPIYIEVKDNICAWIVSDEYWDMPIDASLTSDVYGKTWRCWSARPTNEQREATPWQTPSINASAPNG